MIIWWLGPRKATLTIFLLTISIYVIWTRGKLKFMKNFCHLDWQNSGLLEGLGTETLRLSLISRAGFLCHSSESQWHRISFGWMNILRCYGKSWCHFWFSDPKENIGWNSTTNKNWLMAHPVDGSRSTSSTISYLVWSKKLGILRLEISPPKKNMVSLFM